jgi:hypothetical protein
VCLITPIGTVLWAIVNSEWAVTEDGLHPFHNSVRFARLPVYRQ